MFISYAFPVDHFGKLYGITRVAGGFCVLLSAPIFNTVVKNGNKFKSANFDFAVVTGEIILMTECGYDRFLSIMYGTSDKRMVIIFEKAKGTRTPVRIRRKHQDNGRE